MRRDTFQGEVLSRDWWLLAWASFKPCSFGQIAYGLAAVGSSGFQEPERYDKIGEVKLVFVELELCTSLGF